MNEETGIVNHLNFNELGNVPYPDFSSGVVLYHRSCTDGFMSAWLLWAAAKLINETLAIENPEKQINLQFIPVQYKEEIPNINNIKENDILYIVDFSYSPTDMLELAKKFKKIIMLDHHDSAAEWYNYGCYCFDISVCYHNDNELRHHQTAFFTKLIKEKSGAGLTLKYVDDMVFSRISKTFNDHPIIEKLDLIRSLAIRVEDRDIWNFYHSDTRVVHTLLNNKNYTFEWWYKLIVEMNDSEFADEFNKAKIEEGIKIHYENLWSKRVSIVKFEGYDIAVINCPSDFASNTCDLISKDYPFVIAWSASSTKVFMSLRSNKENGVNVKEIAKKYGGGGHINAAGVSIDSSKLYLFLSGQLNEHNYKD